MKCGRETRGEDVFCQDCLIEMQKYPVQPGTVVLLPRRKDFSTKKVVKRHTPSPDELIDRLQRQIIALLFLLAACIIAIVLMFEPTMHYVRDEHYEIGQNYSSASSGTSESP
jgi:hypothetical protein